MKLVQTVCEGADFWGVILSFSAPYSWCPELTRLPHDSAFVDGLILIQRRRNSARYRRRPLEGAMLGTPIFCDARPISAVLDA
jgi:hypothetical protein